MLMQYVHTKQGKLYPVHDVYSVGVHFINYPVKVGTVRGPELFLHKPRFCTPIVIDAT